MLAFIFYLAYNILKLPPTQEVYCHECEVAKQKEVFYKKELKCLQEAVYFEGRSVGMRGMAMVAQTTINRSKSAVGRSTICDTVYVPSVHKHLYKACAYSFTCDRKSEAMHERKSRDKAYTIAKNALNGKYKSLTKATHFLHCSIVARQGWIKNMKPAGTDGVHCYFY